MTKEQEDELLDDADRRPAIGYASKRRVRAGSGSPCSDWLGISARTKAEILKAAAREGLTVTKARWERVRKGGIMCGPEGGWMVVVRGGPRHCEDVALGLNLAELYDDLLRCGRNLRYLGNRPRAGMPSDKLCVSAPEAGGERNKDSEL